jgi:hypothetical protein
MPTTSGDSGVPNRARVSRSVSGSAISTGIIEGLASRGCRPNESRGNSTIDIDTAPLEIIGELTGGLFYPARPWTQYGYGP